MFLIPVVSLRKIVSIVLCLETSFRFNHLPSLKCTGIINQSINQSNLCSLFCLVLFLHLLNNRNKLREKTN